MTRRWGTAVFLSALFFVLFAAGLVVLPGVTQAALELPTKEDLPSLPAPFNDTENIGLTIAKLWNIAIAAAAIVFMVLLLIGGLQYLTSMGSDDGSKKAKQLLFDAVIGLVLVLVAWPVGTFTINLLGLNETAIGVPPDGTFRDDFKSKQKQKGDPTKPIESGAFLTLPVRVAGAPAGTVLVAESTGPAVSMLTGRQIVSTDPRLAFSQGQYKQTKTTNQQGEATFTDVPSKYELEIWRGANKAEHLFKGYAPVKEGSTTASLLELSSTTKPDQLVTIRVSAVHQGKTTPITTSRVGFFLTSDSDYVTGWNDVENAKEYADVKLRPGATYEVSLSGATMKATQNNTFKVPDSPKGTKEPVAVWTLFVTPTATETPTSTIPGENAPRSRTLQP